MSNISGTGINSLFNALKVQARVLWALLLREASLRSGKHKLGLVLVLSEMIWGATVLGILRHFVGHPPPYGNSIVFYMFTGTFPFSLYRVLQSRVSSALDANKALLSFPVIRPVDTILARAGLETSFMLTAFLIFYGGFVLIEYATPPDKPLELLAAISTMIVFGTGTGVLSMVLIHFISPLKTIIGMINTVLFFVSGIFFQVELMPPSIRDILVWNPLVHGIEWIRYAIYPYYSTQILDKEYFMIWALCSLTFGLAAERLLRRRLLEES